MANESHENPDEHQYTVTLDDMTEDALACTCPHHVYRPAHYTHMAAVEDTTDDGILEAFRPRTTRRTKTMLNQKNAIVMA